MEDAQCLLPCQLRVDTIVSQLGALLRPPWLPAPEEDGVNVLLLSRDKERSVQRRAFFSLSGCAEISVHRKRLCQDILDNIVLPEEENKAALVNIHQHSFIQWVLSVVQRLQSYEVCVGVNDAKFEHLWANDKTGEVDKNPYGELRYKITFRPFACQLLVSTAVYLKQRCPVCVKTRARFAMKIRRHFKDEIHPYTPNVHLDKGQLLSKVIMQQKKLKHTQTKLDRLKAAFQHTLSAVNSSISERVSEELLKICMDHIQVQRK